MKFLFSYLREVIAYKSNPSIYREIRELRERVATLCLEHEEIYRTAKALKQNLELDLHWYKDGELRDAIEAEFPALDRIMDKCKW